MDLLLLKHFGGDRGDRLARFSGLKVKTVDVVPVAGKASTEAARKCVTIRTGDRFKVESLRQSVKRLYTLGLVCTLVARVAELVVLPL